MCCTTAVTELTAHLRQFLAHSLVIVVISQNTSYFRSNFLRPRLALQKFLDHTFAGDDIDQADVIDADDELQNEIRQPGYLVDDRHWNAHQGDFQCGRTRCGDDGITGLHHIVNPALDHHHTQIDDVFDKRVQYLLVQ